MSKVVLIENLILGSSANHSLLNIFLSGGNESDGTSVILHRPDTSGHQELPIHYTLRFNTYDDE